VDNTVRMESPTYLLGLSEVLAAVLIPLYTIIFLGYLCSRLGAFESPPASLHSLNAYLYWVCLPMFIFGGMYLIPLESVDWIFVVAFILYKLGAIFTGIVVATVLLVLQGLRRWRQTASESKTECAVEEAETIQEGEVAAERMGKEEPLLDVFIGNFLVYWLATGYPNALFIGLPLIILLFGPEYSIYAFLSVLPDMIFQIPLAQVLFIIVRHRREQREARELAVQEIEEEEEEEEEGNNPAEIEDDSDGVNKDAQNAADCSQILEEEEENKSTGQERESEEGIILVEKHNMIHVEDVNSRVNEDLQNGASESIEKQEVEGEEETNGNEDNSRAGVEEETSDQKQEKERTLKEKIYVILERPAVARTLQVLKLLAKLFLSPLILGMIAGILFNISGIPAVRPLVNLIKLLSDAVSATALFIIGIFIFTRALVACSWYVALLVLVLKHIWAPLIMLVVALLLQMPNPAFQIAILISSLPLANLVFNIAAQFGVNPGPISTGIIMGTILSPISITIIAVLLFSSAM
jgi:predicted permease